MDQERRSSHSGRVAAGVGGPGTAGEEVAGGQVPGTDPWRGAREEVTGEVAAAVDDRSRGRGTVGSGGAPAWDSDPVEEAGSDPSQDPDRTGWEVGSG
jgi:hypothetical protein